MQKALAALGAVVLVLGVIVSLYPRGRLGVITRAEALSCDAYRHADPNRILFT